MRNSFATSSADMPWPESATETCSRAPCRAEVTITLPPRGVNLTAFAIRLRSTVAIMSASAQAVDDAATRLSSSISLRRAAPCCWAAMPSQSSASGSGDGWATSLPVCALAHCRIDSSSADVWRAPSFRSTHISWILFFSSCENFSASTSVSERKPLSGLRRSCAMIERNRSLERFAARSSSSLRSSRAVDRCSSWINAMRERTFVANSAW